MYDEDLIEDSLAFCKELKTLMGDETSQTTDIDALIHSNINTPEKPDILKQLEEQAAAVKASVAASSASTASVVSTNASVNEEALNHAKAVQAARQAEARREAEEAARQAEARREAEEAARQAEARRQEEEAARQAEARRQEEEEIRRQAMRKAQSEQLAAMAAAKLREKRKAERERAEQERVLPFQNSIKQESVVAQEVETVDVQEPKAEVSQESDVVVKNKDSKNTDPNHTYEITIKFDFANVKKAFQKWKAKLAPEERTLEDVNQAMEENRQIKAEKEQEEKKTITESGAQMAQNAKAILNRVPVGRIKDKVLQAGSAVADRASTGTTSEDEIMDASYAVDNGLEKKVQTRKVSSGSHDFFSNGHLVSNIIILIFCVGIAYFCASFVTNYVAHPTTVEGESMEPTLSDGDSVMIQRVTYYFSQPKRYDVVVFPISYGEADTMDSDTYYIKRVIGLPGETVQILDGCVYINGEQLKDDHYSLTDISDAGVAAEPLVLGEDQFFVMGDNRNMSTDSRNSYVGCVNRKDIVGKAGICIWPFNHFGGLK